MEKIPGQQLPKVDEVNPNKKRLSPPDFFKQNPKIEHSLYKGREKNSKKPIEEVTLRSDKRYTDADYKKVNDLYLSGGKIPYTNIHNHPTGSEDLKLNEDRYNLPSWNDLANFLRDDEMEATAIYQHNPNTNESEGVFVIKKTKETPTSGINWSEWAKGFSSDPKLAEIKFAEKNEELFNAFEFGTSREILHDYFELTNNPQHSRVPKNERQKTRQKLLDEIIKKLHLQIKYVPAEGYYYSPGKGFLKKE